MPRILKGVRRIVWYLLRTLGLCVCMVGLMLCAGLVAFACFIWPEERVLATIVGTTGVVFFFVMIDGLKEIISGY